MAGALLLVAGLQAQDVRRLSVSAVSRTPQKQLPAKTGERAEMEICGTGESETFILSTTGLIADVQISATAGLAVTPTLVKAGEKDVKVTVTNLTTLRMNSAKVIMRSADEREYVYVTTYGTPLPVKDLTANPVYAGGKDAAKTFGADFTPGDGGYTVEFKVKTDADGKEFTPFAVSDKGVGFRGYVSSTGMGLYSADAKKGLSNPANGGTFYNTDGLYHTYRYAVTADKRVIVYRDGQLIDTLRTQDHALSKDFIYDNGPVVENLLVNGDFEGEYNYSASRGIVTHIEGWEVSPWDQWNSTQNIVSEERSNLVDQNNHVLTQSRYMWEAGYAAGEVSQVINVAPGEVYSFSALAKGGIKSDGNQLGSLRIQDLQNDDNRIVIPVTSDSYQTYATDFETRANTRQIRVSSYIERDAWGASISALRTDDAKLTGVSRKVQKTIGFNNQGADIAYFTFDNTGAYAPLKSEIYVSRDSIVIDGTDAYATFTVGGSNLIADINISATHGLTVWPQTVKAGQGPVGIRVTNKTTLADGTGQIILRSADVRKYIHVTTHGTPLVQKDLSQNPVYAGGADTEKTFDGFTPGDGGYTVEFKVKTNQAGMEFMPFAVTSQAVGFKGFVNASSMGLFNSESQHSLPNPANGGTFYNTDGLYHTYRYAVTADKRVMVYRDGQHIATLRTQDFALPAEWFDLAGPAQRNLLVNGDFEGEWDFSDSRNITNYIEGFQVSPWDQYNSYQNIVSEERSNEVDQNNHVVDIHRYMWEAGYAAGEVSQIVNVAPDEIYSFSALAKGGIKSNGNQLGSLRIQDLQNSDNNVVLTVTSDSYQTYAADFETRANTKQIRVSCYLERDAWGASISGLKVDDMKLSGYSRKPTQKIGFVNKNADLAYFTFDNTGAYAPLTADIATSHSALEINGTGASQTFKVSSQNLLTDITLSATHGFSVSPSVIKAGESDVEVTVTNLTTLRHATGRVILRSADVRKYVDLTSTGTELERKDLSQNPTYSGGSDSELTFEGFNPGDNGYTIEFKVKTDQASQHFYPFAVSKSGVGFKGYVGYNSVGLYNSSWEKGLSNPANGGTFYNTDGLYHTYRYAVTSDKRVIVYRDGTLIDTLRLADLALPAEFSVDNGPVVENLLKNPGFEGEHNFSSSRNITTHIEGWDVSPWDQYNSYQDIVSEERSNEVDQNNHVVDIHRYKWSAGWAAAEVSQIVDVAPNEVYSFSALAKGGIKSDGNQLGSIRLQDMQNSDNNITIPITSDSYQTYATDFETRANTQQMRVVLYMERDAWGASISGLKVDDVKLTGVSRKVEPMVGFRNEFADLAYFTFDNTGAYAPLTADITTSHSALEIDGTGASQTFKVSSQNLLTDITLSATHGFSVSPSVIKAGESDVEVTVTNLTTLRHATGRVILRSADVRKYVDLTSTGTELERKDLSQNPTYSGGSDSELTFEGFNPGDNGYTIEFKVKTDQASQHFYPFAVSKSGVGFKGYVGYNSVGLYNSSWEKGLSNPANGGTFYNTDGLYHTYRYAVTSDKRVIVYRDGTLIDTLRLADLALPAEFSVDNGPVVENLLKNPGFEGEHNFSSSRNITTHIEGWDVSPWDQYNSYQDIVSEERSNEVDQNNHVVDIHRYKWSAGWAAAEVSQIVDVAPNEVYSFSALAKGGIKSDGNQLGSIRLQDMQNSDNNITIPITSDSYQTYATDFETRANTQQMRVVLYMERDAWGASISGLKVDDVKLTGVSRKVEPMVGFRNEFADLVYFTFDNTGAYAPLITDIAATDVSRPTDIGDASQHATPVCEVRDGILTVSGLVHSDVTLYDVGGRQVAQKKGVSNQTSFPLKSHGVYICTVMEDRDRYVLKVSY